MREVDTLEGLKQALATSQRAVVYFHSERCPPCIWVNPIYRQIEAEYPDIVFITADIDSSEDMTSTFDISYMPTFLFCFNNTEISRFCGSNSEKLHASLYNLNLSK